jgi:hypothetical protein
MRVRESIAVFKVDLRGRYRVLPDAAKPFARNGHNMTRQKIIAGTLMMMTWSAVLVTTLGVGYVLTREPQAKSPSQVDLAEAKFSQSRER